MRRTATLSLAELVVDDGRGALAQITCGAPARRASLRVPAGGLIKPT